MVGFGPTIFSRKKGDTEYGIKAIPLGGYIRMIGMFPPGDDGRIEARSTSPWRGMIEDARSAAFEELQPGDENRLFYTRKPWKRVIVMFAGPFMNLILAVAIFLGVADELRRQDPDHHGRHGLRSASSSRARSATRARRATTASPAKAAGLQAGDKIVAFDGQPVDDWARPPDAHPRHHRPRHHHRRAATAARKTLHADLIENKVAKTDGNGGYVQGEYVTAGFLGFSPGQRHRPAVLRPVRGPHGRHDRGRRRLAGRPARQDPRPVERGLRAAASASRTPRWAWSARPGSAARSSRSTSRRSSRSR